MAEESLAAYAAEALKFIAVPAAIFELIPDEKRQRIEGWLSHKLIRVITSLVIFLIFLYGAVFLLVKFGPILVLVWVFFGQRVVSWILLVSDTSDSFGNMYLLSLVQGIVVLIAAIFVTVVPRQWITAIAFPFEAFSTWLTGFPMFDLLVPDFSGQAFLNDFDRTFEAFRDWLWDWLAWLSTLYFFWAKGFILVILIMIQFAFIAVVILLCLLTPATLSYVFIRFSGFIKLKLGIERKGQIPVGAVVIWAVGETLAFVVKTIDFF